MPLPAPTQSIRPRSIVSKTKDGESTRALAQDDIGDSEVNSARPKIGGPLHTRSLSYQPGHEGTKRRSFLPQLGAPKHHASSLDQESEDAATHSSDSLAQPGSNAPQLPSVQSSVTSRLRPRSMYQSSSIASEQRTTGNKTISSRHVQAPDAVSKPPGLQSAGLSRSHSLRKPASSVPSSQSSSTRVHSRTQSTNAMAIRRDMPETKTKLDRPKSLLAAPNYTSKPSSKLPLDAPSDSTRTSTRLAALKRSTSTKNKSEVLRNNLPVAPASRPEGPAASQAGRREVSREEPKKSARPAFSTLQQHFTPRKGGKAPTSTFLHPAPDASAHSLPSEIMQLQAELLQLHLLHESSANTSRQWEIDAKNRLRERFDEIVNLYHVMREYERSGQEQKNLQALLEWNGSRSSSGLVEHIQALSGPLDELPALVESGGRLQRVADDFDRWVAWVEEVWAARERRTGYGENSGSLEGLGDAWKSQMAALTRKLTSFLRDLGKLSQPAPGSSIACIIAACKELLGGILEELQTMQMIEAAVVAKEKDWVEGRLQAIARDIGGSLVETNGEHAAWRMQRC